MGEALIVSSPGEQTICLLGLFGKNYLSGKEVTVRHSGWMSDYVQLLVTRAVRKPGRNRLNPWRLNGGIWMVCDPQKLKLGIHPMGANRKNYL